MTIQLFNQFNQLQHEEPTLLKMKKFCRTNMICNDGWVQESITYNGWPFYTKRNGEPSKPYKEFKGAGWYVKKV